ncbi:hypothetical protein BJY21_002076 [Kineosphaera limosa]|uniref:D-glucuronyl C5-epimerase C-terminal domain-containing protein n=1 Tax=Kineosphaera limosa NBRC 100340 TaxID=1184609 RepID=K6WS53_9MICO|nr:D-glucuronyl C5-epimerase family protein [Kineosphaera limosa]NYE00892.1 hypothetical protein [Kineosphaera limosa]GAB94912.1 hypothetical protein KILIM_014_00480 [Kineosphaera limosa NBRC 100340]
MRSRCALLTLALAPTLTLTLALAAGVGVSPTATAQPAPAQRIPEQRIVTDQSTVFSALSAGEPRVSGAASLARVGLLPGSTGPALAAALTAAATITDAQAPATSGWARITGTSLPAFRTGSDTLRRVGPEQRPYARAGLAPLTPDRPHDDAGVLVYERGGQTHDHPVLQARHIPMWTASYRNGGGREYLDKAIAHGERLLTTGEHTRSALYFPYHFDFALHGDDAHPMHAPWYSAMAQGQALSAFVALYETTGQPRWREAADETFASFLRPRAEGRPWTVDVDDKGLLWFEEYAGPNPDRAFNGHMFALFGVYDYWWLTGDPQARQVVLGGLEATRVRVRDIRVPGGTSRYCLTHRVSDDNYHRVHIGQLFTLHTLTGSTDFARLGDAFIDDAPRDRQGGSGMIAAGRVEAVTVDEQGQPASTRIADVAAAQAVEFGARTLLPGRSGVWLRVDSGTLAGTWVREQPDHAWLQGARDAVTFGLPRAGMLGAGTQTGYAADTAGHWTAQSSVLIGQATPVHLAGRFSREGRTYFTVADGPLAGLAIDAADVKVE